MGRKKYSMLLLLQLIQLAFNVTEDSIEETGKLLKHSPLILSFDEGVYQFPEKARITVDDQRPKYYYSKANDVRYFCPNNKATKEHAYCLFEKTFEKRDKKICEDEVKPLIVEDKNTSNFAEYCGSESSRMYKFSYLICVDKKSGLKKVWHKMNQMVKKAISEDVQFPVYEICYNHSENRVLFTRHKIRSPHIFRNLLLNDEKEELNELKEKYSTDNYDIANLENLKRISKAYELIQEQNLKDNKYVLQMLVPTNDFALSTWMKATFHMINYGIQHESNIPLWNMINSHVHDRLLELFGDIGHVTIYTGTWGKLVDENREPIYVGNDPDLGVTIPMIWWKLLYSISARKAIVIVMHNDDDKTKKCQPEESACDVAKWRSKLLVHETMSSKSVYCCSAPSASDFIPKYSELKIGEPFDILKLD